MQKEGQRDQQPKPIWELAKNEKGHAAKPISAAESTGLEREGLAWELVVFWGGSETPLRMWDNWNDLASHQPFPGDVAAGKYFFVYLF